MKVLADEGGITGLLVCFALDWSLVLQCVWDHQTEGLHLLGHWSLCGFPCLLHNEEHSLLLCSLGFCSGGLLCVCARGFNVFLGMYLDRTVSSREISLLIFSCLFYICVGCYLQRLWSDQAEGLYILGHRNFM